MSKAAFDKISEGLKEALGWTKTSRVVVFVRADSWYPITVSHDEDLAQHAELNPGTLRIEDGATGEVLWQPS